MPLNATNPVPCFRLLALALLLFITVPADAEIVLTQNEDSMPARQDTVPPGTLVMPGDRKESQSKKDKCMTVCARWGEECTYINRGTGGTTRKCRRTCKQFTEECF